MRLGRVGQRDIGKRRRNVGGLVGRPVDTGRLDIAADGDGQAAEMELAGLAGRRGWCRRCRLCHRRGDRRQSKSRRRRWRRGGGVGGLGMGRRRLPLCRAELCIALRHVRAHLLQLLLQRVDLLLDGVHAGAVGVLRASRGREQTAGQRGRGTKASGAGHWRFPSARLRGGSVTRGHCSSVCNSSALSVTVLRNHARSP